jgi:hypothetical protein
VGPRETQIVNKDLEGNNARTALIKTDNGFPTTEDWNRDSNKNTIDLSFGWYDGPLIS